MIGTPATGTGGEVVARLAHRDAHVRRIAAMDAAGWLADQSVMAAVTDRLATETDDRASVILIRVLAEARYGPALESLEALRDDASRDVRVYHAALLACDEFEGTNRAPGPIGEPGRSG